MGLFGRIIKGSSGQEGIVDNKAIDKPRPVELNSNSGKFRVVDVFNIRGVGVIPVGDVVSGQLTPGMKANLNGKIVTIKSMEMNHQKLSIANVGDKLGMGLKGAKKEDLEREQIIEFTN